MTIEELFGTLQQSTVATWRKHLRTAKYGKHEALDEFYKEMPEKVDALIEAWMGAHGKKVKGYENLLHASNMNTLKYLGELKKVCKNGYELMGDNDELKGLLDDIVNLINSTLYKVKELSESTLISLSDYVMESLVNEAMVRSMTVGEFVELVTGNEFTADKTPDNDDLADNLANDDYTFWELDGESTYDKEEVATELANLLISKYNDKTRVTVMKASHGKRSYQIELDGHIISAEFEAA
jgi:hypothetical protein